MYFLITVKHSQVVSLDLECDELAVENLTRSYYVFFQLLRTDLLLFRSVLNYIFRILLLSDQPYYH